MPSFLHFSSQHILWSMSSLHHFQSSIFSHPSVPPPIYHDIPPSPFRSLFCQSYHLSCLFIPRFFFVFMSSQPFSPLISTSYLSTLPSFHLWLILCSMSSSYHPSIMSSLQNSHPLPLSIPLSHVILSPPSHLRTFLFPLNPQSCNPPTSSHLSIPCHPLTSLSSYLNHPSIMSSVHLFSSFYPVNPPPQGLPLR